ncbi:glycosyltransferase family 2 protein [Myxococcota bacterium]|nr:glycosyltransferase family 2 protein [Myxococcota bacterium]
MQTAEAITTDSGLDAPEMSVIIPVYNEAAIIEGSIRELCARLDKFSHSYEVIIAENGSKDETAEIARMLTEELPRVKLLQTGEPNYGKALRAGIMMSRGKYVHCDEIDICDADFHRRARELFHGEDGGFDMVVGSKTMAGARDGRPLSRRAATKVINGILRVSLGFRGTDTHGLKAFRREAILPIVESCVVDRDMFASELVLRAERAKKRICEIPLNLKEKREPSIQLTKRVPRVLKNVAQLVYVIRIKGR